MEHLEKTDAHPTADEVHHAVLRKFPSISRATVYNTLDALTKAGIVRRLSVDPSVARYDADLGAHAHLRCRICERVLDLEMQDGHPASLKRNGHRIESIRTYAYGVCADCLEDEATAARGEPRTSSNRKNASEKRSAGELRQQTSPDQQKTAKPTSASDASDRGSGPDQKKPKASSSGPSSASEEVHGA